MHEQRFRFGAFTLDAARGVLLRDGMPVSAGQRAIALLQSLVAANGRVVSKAELVEAAWPKSVVEESNLTVQIAALRRILGATAEGTESIATVARVGYRFLLPVRVVAPGSSGLPGPAPSPVSLAVLPLVNLSGDAEQEYFADGVTEDLIMALSRFRWFRVIGRSGSFAFKGQALPARQLADRLGVRYLLEGSVRKSLGRVRIALQLVDGDDGAECWCERYDFAPADVLAVQDAIAEQVAGAIEPELLKMESTASAARGAGADASAQDLVHRGTWLFHQVRREGHLEARELFRQALRVDASFAAAQFWLARVSAGIVAYGWSASPDEDLREGLAAAAGAIRADEKNPYAHYALAIVSCYADALDQAARSATRAVDLAPGFALGHLVLGMARLYAGAAREAVHSLTHGLHLNAFDPQNFVWWHLLAYAHLFAGEPGPAIAAARQAQQARPDWPPAHESALCAFVLQGEHEQARACAGRIAGMPRTFTDPAGPLKRHNPAWAGAISSWHAQAGLPTEDGAAGTQVDGKPRV
jgi:TolB-like protein